MTFRAWYLLVILPALLTVVACSSLGRNITGYPLAVPLAGNHFPANSEILAAVELSSAQGSEKFLMALGVSDSGMDLVILNPQGLPLYTAGFASGRWQVSRKAATAGQFKPHEFLAYLGLIYFDEGAIMALLADGWRYQADSPKRIDSHERIEGRERMFSRDDNTSLAASEIHIHYEGVGPWYQAVRLQDTARGTQLHISTLEYKHVLPE